MPEEQNHDQGQEFNNQPHGEPQHDPMPEQQSAPQPEQQVAGTGSSSFMKMGIAAVAVVVVAGLGFLFWQSQNATDDASGGVVATVNGEEISRQMFEARMSQMESVFAAQGMDTSTDVARGQMQEQALEALINEALILQEARAAGITVSDADVDAHIAQVQSQFPEEGGFEAELEAQGLTLEEFRALVADQLLVEQYAEQELGIGSVTATDAEIEEFYNELVALSEEGDEVPPLEEVRSDLEQALILQKQQEMASQFLEGLWDANDIEILI